MKYFIWFFLLYPTICLSFDNLSKQEIPNNLLESMWKNPLGPYAADAVYQFENGKYYWLFKDKSIGVYDLSINSNIDGWPIIRWTHLNLPDELQSVYRFLRYKKEQIGEPSYNQNVNSIGCLNQTPLRYGPVLNATQNDIVLTLGSQLFIFSPTYLRVIFQEYVDHSDWFPEEKGNNERARFPVDTDVQYISKAYAAVGLGSAEPAYRGYSKLFVGDFDNDNHPDILVWRKIYKTNLQSNAVKGFTLTRNEWQHFEQDLTAQAALSTGVTGEVLPQETEATVIQTWLTDNNLTWQKGYPSQSECAGQAGQLIPEMHDPLLNDPEVLQ